MTSYIYTFIRRDLSPEQRIVQIGHACYEAGKEYHHIDGIPNLVLLEAKDENELIEISVRIENEGIENYTFHEPDYNTGFTAICTRPITSERERAFFKKWELFKHTA